MEISLISILFNIFWLFTGFIFFIIVYECITYVPFQPAIKKSRSLGNTKFDERKLPDKIDAIVIGSGQGGLSCAAVLAQFGYKVVVCEQHEVTGGGAHTFSVGGQSSKYKFNAGHHLSIPLHEHLLQLTCGAKIPPVPFGILKDDDGANDRVIYGCKPKNEIPLPIKDDIYVLNELCQRFPNHKKNILKYFNLAETIQLKFALLIGAALLPNWLRGLFIRSPMMSIWRLWANKTTADGLKDILPGEDEESRRLRSYAIGLWLDVGSPPSRSSFFMQTAVFGGWQKVGVAYPKGTPQTLSLAMCEVIERNGGCVFISCPVIQVILNQQGNQAQGVLLANGKTLSSPIIISGLGYRVTEKLIPSLNKINSTTNIPYQLKTKQGCGFLMANIGLNGKAKDLGITVANLWLQPACEENGWDALKGVEDFMTNPLEVPYTNIPAGICFPSTKDGRTNPNLNEDELTFHTCQILVPVEWSWFAKYAHVEMIDFDPKNEPFGKHAPPNIQRQYPKEYESLKKIWSDRLLLLLLLHYPKIKELNKNNHVIEFINISTPLSIENYARPGQGAAIGLDVTPERFVELNEFKELNHKHPKIKHFWRAGQDYLMTGQVLASASGLICALRILGPIAMIRFIIRSIRLLLPRLFSKN